MHCGQAIPTKKHEIMYRLVAERNPYSGLSTSWSLNSILLLTMLSNGKKKRIYRLFCLLFCSKPKMDIPVSLLVNWSKHHKANQFALIQPPQDMAAFNPLTIMVEWHSRVVLCFQWEICGTVLLFPHFENEIWLLGSMNLFLSLAGITDLLCQARRRSATRPRMYENMVHSTKQKPSVLLSPEILLEIASSHFKFPNIIITPSDT